MDAVQMVYSGNTMELTFYVKESDRVTPYADIQNAVLFFTLKRFITDPDSKAIATAKSGEGIAILSTAEAKGLVTIGADKLKDVEGGVPYVMDLMMKTADGKFFTVYQSEIIFQRTVTQRTV